MHKVPQRAPNYLDIYTYILIFIIIIVIYRKDGWSRKIWREIEVDISPIRWHDMSLDDDKQIIRNEKIW